MSAPRHDRWDTGESLAGWDDDAPAGPGWAAWLIASIVAACVIGGVLALGKLALASVRENAPPVSEAGGALPSSNLTTTEGTAP